MKASQLPFVPGTNVHFALICTGGQNLGRCYNQTNYHVYTNDSFDPKWDDVMALGCRSTDRLARLKAFLPTANAGAELGAFTAVENDTGNPCQPQLYVAPYWVRTDSGD